MKKISVSVFLSALLASSVEQAVEYEIIALARSEVVTVMLTTSITTVRL